MKRSGYFYSLLLVALCAGFMAGCPDNGGGKNMCDKLESKLAGCGLLTPGLFLCWESPTRTEKCYDDCILAASCDSLEDAVCLDEGPLYACQNDCDERYVYTCSGGSEIPEYWLCDGEEDCEDGSDEARCPTFECRDGSDSIPEIWHCDGEEDCDDGSDEANCNTFTCADQLYSIPAEWECDGEEDCDDGSDEVGCPQIAQPYCPLDY